MSKPSDRVFHLVVSAFALTLTAVSGAIVLYQRDPADVKSWIKPLQQSTWLSRLTGTNVTHGHAQPTTNHSNPVSTPTQRGGLPTYMPADNASLVHVSAYGNDVPASQLQTVTGLLSNYRIPDVISRSLQMNLLKPVHIYLAQNATDYKNVLAWLGVSLSEAQRFSQDTGGFTQGDSIVIPLYQNKSVSDLANTVGHELTHAFLNYNTGTSLPSWVNEGTAVTMGMEFQQLSSDTPAAYEGYARQMEESVLDATKTGKLIPLTADEAKVLAGTADYDLELQDWLAVRLLVKDYGFTGLATYLRLLADNEPEPRSFTQAFGMSAATFNNQFTNLLKQSVDMPDAGVVVTMQVPASYHGLFRVLQHGSQSWDGFRPTTGSNSFTLTPSGELTGQPSVRTVPDSSPPDATTTYINLDPDSELSYNGQPVNNCGFAIDYHYGTYAFVNAWVTYKDGKSVYLQAPSLFGVTLADVKEASTNNVLLSLLETPKPL